MVGYLGCLLIAGLFLLIGLVWGKRIGRKREKKVEEDYAMQFKAFKRGMEERLQVSEELVSDSRVPLITVPREEYEVLKLLEKNLRIAAHPRVSQLEKKVLTLRAENVRLRQAFKEKKVQLLHLKADYEGFVQKEGD